LQPKCVAAGGCRLRLSQSVSEVGLAMHCRTPRLDQLNHDNDDLFSSHVCPIADCVSNPLLPVEGGHDNGYQGLHEFTIKNAAVETVLGTKFFPI
jgi:hypothetical protein